MARYCLQAASFNLRDVDWVITNAGADIRHLSCDGVTWVDDDRWEDHIGWRCASQIRW